MTGSIVPCWAYGGQVLEFYTQRNLFQAESGTKRIAMWAIINEQETSCSFSPSRNISRLRAIIRCFPQQRKPRGTAKRQAKRGGNLNVAKMVCIFWTMSLQQGSRGFKISRMFYCCKVQGINNKKFYGRVWQWNKTSIACLSTQYEICSYSKKKFIKEPSRLESPREEHAPRTRAIYPSHVPCTISRKQKSAGVGEG